MPVVGFRKFDLKYFQNISFVFKKINLKNILHLKFWLQVINFIFCLLLLLCSQKLIAQNSLPQILVSGTAIDSISKRTVSGVQIVNMKTLQRFYSDENGIFFFQCTIKDTLYVTSQGFSPFALCFKDSVSKNSFTITIKLKRINVDLPEVVIGSKRSFAEINKDAQKLGYNKNDYRMPRSVAYMSPISALYEEFSKKERSKRKVAEMVNNDKRKVLLHELLFFYYRNSVINLNPAEFDDFIDYNNFNDDLLKSLSAYDLAVYLKSKIAVYESRR